MFYFNTSELGKTLNYMGLRPLRLISFQWSSGSESILWISDSDFHCKFFVFCILYCQNFWTRDDLECIVNPTYLIECCDCTPFNPDLKITIVIIFNTTHKMGCCEYWYCLGWYNIWYMKSESLNYPFLG